MYKEIITTIGDLKPDDKVMGKDGKWHNIKLLPIHIPKEMYEIEFTNGKIKCSGDHEWTIYGNVTKVAITITTNVIYDYRLKGMYVGEPGGPQIINIKKIPPEPCRCIHVLDSDDMLFEILTEQEEVKNKFDIKFNVLRDN